MENALLDLGVVNFYPTFPSAETLDDLDFMKSSLTHLGLFREMYRLM